MEMREVFQCVWLNLAKKNCFHYFLIEFDVFKFCCQSVLTTHVLKSLGKSYRTIGISALEYL